MPADRSAVAEAPMEGGLAYAQLAGRRAEGVCRIG